MQDDVVVLKKQHVQALLAHASNPMHPVIDHSGSYGSKTTWLICRICGKKSEPVNNGTKNNDIFHKKDCGLAATYQALEKEVRIEP